MKISSGKIPGRAVVLSAALIAVSALDVSAQDPPPAIVQPGAPGQPTRTLTDAEVAALRQPLHVEEDVRFMQGMTFHHAQALQMTGLLPSRTERDEMRLLAQRIDISQTAEMGMMKEWLESRGEEAPDLEDEDVWPLGDDRLMPGMLTERQMAQLAAATGEEFDRLFLEFMILHHRGALAMVEQLYLVSGAAQEPQIFQFLTHVDADQSIEIARMNTMLLAIR
jgi:uncharacterized protein (DUF305 family)